MGFFTSFFTTVVVITVGVVCLFIFFVIAEQKKVNAMTPNEKLDYEFGTVNVHLVCPHCQTTGKVRSKSVTRQMVSSGTVGGIFKTNTNSSTFKTVTQHHCDHCGSTWDI